MTKAAFNQSVNCEIRRRIQQGKDKTVMIQNQKCICLHEEPQGIRPGPNAQTRLQADPKCYFCRGEGTLTLDVSYDPPPYQRKGAEWNATIDGSETGPQGYGSTKQAAVDDLLIRMVEASN